MLASDSALADFQQGRRPKAAWFVTEETPQKDGGSGFAVFSPLGEFIGIIYCNGKYGFVVN
jgi:hypothetical protein